MFSAIVHHIATHLEGHFMEYVYIAWGIGAWFTLGALLEMFPTAPFLGKILVALIVWPFALGKIVGYIGSHVTGKIDLK